MDAQCVSARREFWAIDGDCVLERLKDVARQRPWLPDHGAMLLRQKFDRNRNARGGFSDLDHIKAAARWLCAAQDSQTDGGIAGRYRLDRGWTSSYPETTGYLIPTLLKLDRVLPGLDFMKRAARAVEFLLGVQLPDGAFPAMEIAENRIDPTPFDTGQILHGLIAWHKATGDERARAAAQRAANWLIAAQDADGAYRRHTYLGVATTYTAHLTCWLAEWGAYAGDAASLKAAERHLDWVLSHVQPNGWIGKMGFNKEQHEADEAYTHTIAYTIWGILMISEIVGRDDGIAVARRAAEAMLRLTELKRWMPGVVSNWKTRNEAACLTGNAQMALIWFRLHRRSPDLRFVNVALKVIDMIKAAQPMEGRNPAIVGGIAGSDPIGGPYIINAFPNWAAKFYIDALLEKQAVLADIRPAPRSLSSIAPKAARTAAPASPLHAVLITTVQSRKVPKMIEAFADLKFGRLTVVAERRPEAPAFERIEARLKDGGLDWLQQRLRPKSAPAQNGAAHAAPVPDVLTYCRARGIEILETGPLNQPEAIAAVKGLNADLGIHAGGPILRPALLDCFRLGVVNAHMGLIPVYRGMSAAEWPALEGASVGCSVHLIDRGIDTGPLLARRAVDIADCRSVGALFLKVDQAQLALLNEVLRLAITTGALPQVQDPPEPVAPQYYRMHEDLLALLQRRLASA